MKNLIFELLTSLNKSRSRQGLILIFLLVLLGVLSNLNGEKKPLKPLSSVSFSAKSIQGTKSYEVFGFAPYWTFNKLDNVDFNTLTTLAYFGVPVGGDGNLDKTDQGYITYKSKKATEVFQKSHDHGTRVVLTLTQMNDREIIALLDNPEAQDRAVAQAVSEVSQRGIDGINIDFEYDGDPGLVYRNKFTEFVGRMVSGMHQANPNSKVTVSVYAASVKDPKIYDIGELSQVSDGIFMMAYDFAVASADEAMPTAPLYGHKDGTYWYDVSTAVDDFLTQMPADKLILGVPWYGYNYSVYQPGVKAATGWGMGVPQPYTKAKDSINPDQEGWDDKGKVSWQAYYDGSGGWRMIFLEDPKSLGIKYDFAKDKNLAGVGIWALGFDAGKSDLWHVLKDKFGYKDKDGKILAKDILGEEKYD